MDSPWSRSNRRTEVFGTIIYRFKKKRAFANNTFATICQSPIVLTCSISAAAVPFFSLQDYLDAIAMGQSFHKCALIDFDGNASKKFLHALREMWIVIKSKVIREGKVWLFLQRINARRYHQFGAGDCHSCRMEDLSEASLAVWMNLPYRRVLLRKEYRWATKVCPLGSDQIWFSRSICNELAMAKAVIKPANPNNQLGTITSIVDQAQLSNSARLWIRNSTALSKSWFGSPWVNIDLCRLRNLFQGKEWNRFGEHALLLAVAAYSEGTT